jgi:hypothetical protein
LMPRELRAKSILKNAPASVQTMPKGTHSINVMVNKLVQNDLAKLIYAFKVFDKHISK